MKRRKSCCHLPSSFSPLPCPTRYHTEGSRNAKPWAGTKCRVAFPWGCPLQPVPPQLPHKGEDAPGLSVWQQTAQQTDLKVNVSPLWKGFLCPKATLGIWSTCYVQDLRQGENKGLAQVAWHILRAGPTTPNARPDVNAGREPEHQGIRDV